MARRAVSAVDRDVRSRVLATLTKKFGDLDLAEDALQDAIAQALITWSRTGVPDSPEAWLTTTAKRKALDVVRRESVLAGKLARLHTESERASTPAEFRDPAEAPPPGLPDERLGMFFACTHPVLRAEDRVALTLRFVAGLTTAEVAHALLIPVPTTQQRIVRAKKRIGALSVPFAPPREGDLPRRLGGVLRVIYLLFSEGFARSTGDAHIRDDLTDEAVALARTLRALLPNAETTGLLALLLLTQSRRPARLDSDGRPVPLDDQDRRLWDQALVGEGIALAEHAAAQAGAGLYTIQAAIAAVHAEAPSTERTDWAQILALYDLLVAFAPGPMTSLNRIVAVAMVHGERVALRELDAAAATPAIAGHHRRHAVRAHLLERLGETDAAIAEYRAAARSTLSIPEQRYLTARAQSLSL